MANVCLLGNSIFDNTSYVGSGPDGMNWAQNIIPHPLVYLLTFARGILFSRTWLESRSTLAVSIEHALYGFKTATKISDSRARHAA